MNELQLLKRKFEKERLAKKQAEAVLEKKALELYRLNEQLELKIAKRTKELSISEEKYRGIIENMELGLLELDNYHLIIRAYDWFCDMTGYTQKELLGKNAYDFLYVDNLAEKFYKKNKNPKGQAAVFESQIKHKLGHNIWVLVSGSYVVDTNGKVTGFIGIHYDITQRKILEQALVKAKKEAELAQEAEKQFLARMSHEIRTPLNAIIGMAHLLKDTNPSREQSEYLSVLTQSSNILKLLISDILDFSKIQAGKVEIKYNEFNIWELIQNLYRIIQLKVQEKEVLVSFEIDAAIDYYVIGDELLLNQILINLLSNANKFTLEGEIGVVVSQIKETTEWTTLEFRVYDTGIGIPLKDQESVFQSFKQVEEHMNISQNTEKIDGTGLGLAITKNLVEVQGGAIELESELNIGSTFTFDITYQKSRKISFNQVEQNNKIDSFDFSNVEILIVEDNHMNQKYITALFNKWNVHYELANDGLEALDMAFAKPYNLILMDISMPKMNGYQTTEMIRNHPNFNQQTPIIALSAMAFKKEREKAFDVGMTDFLGKPFAPITLSNILKIYLNSEEKEPSLFQQENTFRFPSELNVKELNSLYGADYEYASEMFDLFIEHTLKGFDEVKFLIVDENYQELKNQVHKLKPNFSMVGLSVLRSEMEKIERLSLEQGNKGVIFELYGNIKTQLDEIFPLLQETTDKLRALNHAK